MIPQPEAPIQLASARATISELVELLRPACERCNQGKEPQHYGI